jgi:YbbR domain-containing protein
MMNDNRHRRTNGQGRFFKVQQFFERLMNSRIFLAAVSLVAAAIIWGVMVASDGTLVRRKFFSDIPTTLTGESALLSRGYIVTDDLSQTLPSVDMLVEVTQANYDRVTASSYNPHFELNQVTGEGENLLSIVYSSQIYGQVISCEPSEMTVHVERYVSRRVPVVLVLDGSLTPGIALSSYRTDPNMLTVSGPQSLVNRVSRVMVTLDQSVLSSKRMSDRMAVAITLQDSAGETIPMDRLTVTNQGVITSTVNVEVEMQTVRSVSLMPEAFVTGNPAEGYVLSGVDLEITEVPVSGTEEALRAIRFITGDNPLDITGATGEINGYVRIHRVTGMDNSVPAEVSVKARIVPIQGTRTFRQVAIECLNLGARQTATLNPQRVTVTVSGPLPFLKEMTAGDVLAYVDASDLEAGSHVLPIQVRVDNAPELTFSLGTPEASVNVRTR